jgi:hypothetical protein
MAYEAFVLLPSDSDVSIEKIHQIFKTYYSSKSNDVTFNVKESKLTITIDNWNFRIDLNSEPYVIEESKDLADLFAKNRLDKNEIASSGIRLEISTDDDDEMDFFNYYVESLEQLEKLKGSKVWESAQQAFIN